MSYGRNPYYIYSDGDTLFLNGTRVSEGTINAFLYKILLTNRREELKKRLQEGKQSWLEQIRLKDPKSYDFEFIEVPQDDPEVLRCKIEMEQREDEIIRTLMGE